ncbi:Hypothetical Protein FCC1311_036822 [Hondaea fermentalgiana]|uniref:GRIP domain-containing protein n=1 Tax=Hondaea fermentalgiana TaxID=2315210 RepID=A0A2R5GGR5_9STRA|nr:Hypothetical Protein FCC1311_036822 [Hondaea fermentalgiana]|eukprot:GBG27461.1 Hypothetical Protein FCC1311_036822 [Hondaea fermentalgiana]
MDANEGGGPAPALVPAPEPTPASAEEHQEQTQGQEQTQEQQDEQQAAAAAAVAVAAAAPGQGAVANGAAGGGNKKESVPYLKKLLSVAKRSIDDLKKKLQQRDEALGVQRKENQALQEQLERVKDLTRRAQRRIEDLEGRLEDAQGEPEEPRCPIAARLRVRDEAAGLIWCLIETAPGVTEWVEEEEVFDRIGSNSVPFPMPALSLSESESATLSQRVDQLSKTLEETQDKFRRYKMKMEMSLKRKDAEVTRLAENNLKYKQHNITGHDYYSQLEYSRREIERLSAALDDSSKEVTTLRKRNNDLDRRLRNADAEQQALHKRIVNLEASTSNKNGEEENNNKPELQTQHSGRSLPIHRPDAGAEHAALVAKHTSLLEQHDKLRDEYDKFRIHAQKLLEEERNRAASAQQPKSAVDMHSPHASSVDSSLGFEDNSAAATQAATEREYIKNIFLKYLGAREGVEKETIEAALATALRFSPDQVKWVQDQKSSVAAAQAAAGGFMGRFFSNT